MRKGWKGYKVDYDGHCRYFNSERNALLHANTLALKRAYVIVSVNNKVLAEWHGGRLMVLAPFINPNLFN